MPFLFTAGPFSAKHRFLIFQIASHFGWKAHSEERQLPVVPLSDVLDAKLDVTLLEPIAEGGNVTLLELLVLSSLTKRAITPTIFEIGTFDGRTTLNLAANLPPGGKVFTLDLPRAALGATEFELAPGEAAFVDKKSSGSRFTGTEQAKLITQLYGDSASYDFGPYRDQIGLVFIDGSHAFDYVLKDTHTAMSLVAEGGTIVWHDYGPSWPDVVRALNECYNKDPELFRLTRIEGTSLAMLKTAV